MRTAKKYWRVPMKRIEQIGFPSAIYYPVSQLVTASIPGKSKERGSPVFLLPTSRSQRKKGVETKSKFQS